jgi:2-polyprenyl-3-methyl-5-hydroxy-6-metoxy-1,4-benzoquinol methylase
MYNLSYALIENISKKSELQKKFFLAEFSRLKSCHLQELETLITFYHSIGKTTDDIANAYLNFVECFMEERMYFVRNNDYRYHSYAETSQLYSNAKYMSNYMIGLSLAIYLVQLQRDTMDFFISHCKTLCHPPEIDSRLLEVGTGHGLYFVSCIKNTNFKNYIGIDISQTSVEFTKRFANYCIKDTNKHYSIVQKDFFDFNNNETFDAIVMGQILEHVENPGDFLKKAKMLAKDKAVIYVSIAINSPYPDHIKLFRHADEIHDLFDKVGLRIVDELLITPGLMGIEKAYRKKYDIVASYILSR